MATLSLNGVRKSYGAVEILKSVDIELEDGGFLVLLGPSGCGKSTLLSMIAGLEAVTAGDIRIGDKVVNDIHPKDRNIAMVFQSYALYPTMSVAENIGFGLKMRGIDGAERQRRIDDAARLLQVEALLGRKPGQLSGGQRQRVAMGRAIVRDPELFLFDEPLSNLDAKLRAEMRTEIKRLHDRLGTTVVYVTHDQVEAMTLGTRVAVMKGGEIQQLGTPDEVYDRPANMFVAGFIGSPSINFIEGRLETGGDHTRFHYGEGLVLSLPAHAAPRVAGKVILGTRPEHLRLAAGDGPDRLAGIVDVVEPTGPDTMIVMRVGGQPVTARLAPRQRPNSGEAIHLSVEIDSLSFFDSKTGVRLARG